MLEKIKELFGINKRVRELELVVFKQKKQMEAMTALHKAEVEYLNEVILHTKQLYLKEKEVCLNALMFWQKNDFEKKINEGRKNVGKDRLPNA